MMVVSGSKVECDKSGHTNVISINRPTDYETSFPIWNAQDQQGEESENSQLFFV